MNTICWMRVKTSYLTLFIWRKSVRSMGKRCAAITKVLGLILDPISFHISIVYIYLLYIYIYIYILCIYT